MYAYHNMPAKFALNVACSVRYGVFLAVNETGSIIQHLLSITWCSIHVSGLRPASLLLQWSKLFQDQTNGTIKCCNLTSLSLLMMLSCITVEVQLLLIVWDANVELLIPRCPLTTTQQSTMIPVMMMMITVFTDSSCATSDPVSTRMGDRLWTGKPSRYVISQLGRLSLLPSVGR